MRTAAPSLPRSSGGPWRRRLGLALLGLVAALSAGCGWRAGYELPGGARTVAVEYLDNRTLLRELEVPFAEELHRALLDRVPAQLGSGAETDLVIRGTLIDLRRRGGITNIENDLLEGGEAIQVQLVLVRRADGEVLARAERQMDAGFALEPFESPSAASAQPAAQRRLLRYLAEGLVIDLLQATQDGSR